MTIKTKIQNWLGAEKRLDSLIENCNILIERNYQLDADKQRLRRALKHVDAQLQKRGLAMIKGQIVEIDVAEDAARQARDRAKMRNMAKPAEPAPRFREGEQVYTPYGMAVIQHAACQVYGNWLVKLTEHNGSQCLLPESQLRKSYTRTDAGHWSDDMNSGAGSDNGHPGANW